MASAYARNRLPPDSAFPSEVPVQVGSNLTFFCFPLNLVLPQHSVAAAFGQTAKLAEWMGIKDAPIRLDSQVGA